MATILCTSKRFYTEQGYFTEHGREAFRNKRIRTGEDWLTICEQFGFDIGRDVNELNRWSRMIWGEIPTPLHTQVAFSSWLLDQNL